MSGKSTWLVGGARLNAPLFQAGLVDHIGLFVVPKVQIAGQALADGVYISLRNSFSKTAQPS